VKTGAKKGPSENSKGKILLREKTWGRSVRGQDAASLKPKEVRNERSTIEGTRSGTDSGQRLIVISS